MLLIGCNLLEHFEVQRTELTISHVEGTASQVMLQKVIFWTQEMLCEAVGDPQIGVLAWLLSDTGRL